MKSLPKRDQVLRRVFAPQSVQSWDFAGAVERQNFCFEEINTEYQHHPRSGTTGNRHKRPPPNKSAERPHGFRKQRSQEQLFSKLSGKVTLNTGVINSDKHVHNPLPNSASIYRPGSGVGENCCWQFVFVRDLCMFGIHRGKKSPSQGLQSYCVHTVHTPTRG